MIHCAFCGAPLESEATFLTLVAPKLNEKGQQVVLCVPVGVCCKTNDPEVHIKQRSAFLEWYMR